MTSRQDQKVIKRIIILLLFISFMSFLGFGPTETKADQNVRALHTTSSKSSQDQLESSFGFRKLINNEIQ